MSFKFNKMLVVGGAVLALSAFGMTAADARVGGGGHGMGGHGMAGHGMGGRGGHFAGGRGFGGRGFGGRRFVGGYGYHCGPIRAAAGLCRPYGYY